jgi:hypothetical protein
VCICIIIESIIVIQRGRMAVMCKEANGKGVGLTGSYSIEEVGLIGRYSIEEVGLIGSYSIEGADGGDVQGGEW